MQRPGIPEQLAPDLPNDLPGTSGVFPRPA